MSANKSSTDINEVKNIFATECTPLLTDPVSTYVLRSSGFSVNQRIVRDNGSTNIAVVNEPFLDLRKAISNLPSGVEIETISALGSVPDGDKDLSVKKDYKLDLSEVENDVGDGSPISFHGGISERKFWVIFAGILIANFVAAADSTIMASTHTSITSAFNSSNAASWLSTSFMLTSTSFQPLYGRVSDTVGRKIPFVFSCFVFTIATVWCALAGSIGSFIAARAVCGIGAGGMLTMGAIVLSDILPIEIRGNYQSINNLAYGAGSALGAAVGGLLADSIGWRWEFGIQVPFGLFCMIVCMLTIPSPENLDGKLQVDMWEKFREFDIAGSIYLTTSVACLILGMNLGGNIFPWTHPIVVISLVLSVVLGRLLLRAERIAKFPVMPLELIWGPPRGNLIFNNFFGAATINTVFFNLPLYFQTVLLESATVTGSRLLVPSLAGTTTSVAAGIIITRTGRLKPILFLGSVIVVLGTICLCCMERTFPGWMFLLFLIPTNLGVGFVFPSTLMSVLATSSQSEQAVATSTLILWRCLGGVIGVASSSLIVQNCLNYFLDKRVTGEEKREVINKVRKSVTAIFDLPRHTQEQVISSYDSSLRICFIWSVFTAIVGFLLIVGVQLPLISRPYVQGVKRGSGLDSGIKKGEEHQEVYDEC